MFEPFATLFPESSSRETRKLIVCEAPGPEAKKMLPTAEYEYHELFCSDLECDCERVVFCVLSPQYPDGTVLAVIEMDLRPVPLHKRLLGAGNPRLLTDYGKVPVEVTPEYVRFSPLLLQLFTKELASNVEYIDRVRRHQKLFREARQAREEEVYPLPGGRPPLDGKAVRALADLYRETRSLSKILNDGPILEFRGTEPMNRAAARLGLIGPQNILIIDSEAEFGCMMELAHYGLRSAEGETLVQRYSRAHGADADEPTRRILSAMNEARFAVLKIESIIPELGAVVTDVWRNESGLLADFSLANIGRNVTHMVGHYLRLPEFWMGGGGMVGVSQPTAVVVTSTLISRLNATSASTVDALPFQHLEEVTALSILYILSGRIPPLPKPKRSGRLPQNKPSSKNPAPPKRRRHR